MTKQNQCWKKIRPLGRAPNDSLNWVLKGDRYDYVSVIPNERNLSGKIFNYSVETRFSNRRVKTKPCAIRLAKKYMKEHDKC